MIRKRTVILILLCCFSLNLLTGCSDTQPEKQSAAAAISDQDVNYQSVLNSGLQYYNSVNGRDFNKAFEAVLTAAENGLSDAYEFLGFMYYMGIGTGKNTDAAYKWFSKAEAEGYPNADYGKNDLIYSYGDVMLYYLPGGAVDEYQTGLNYYYGINEKQDFRQAFISFQNSAELYNPYGFYGMALCYLHGNYVEQSYEKCIENLEKAAESRCLMAEYKLYRIYSGEYGDICDDDKAEYYFNSITELIGKGVNAGFDELIFSDEFVRMLTVLEDRTEAFEILSSITGKYDWHDGLIERIAALVSAEENDSASVPDLSGADSPFDYRIDTYIYDYYCRAICSDEERDELVLDKYGFFKDDLYSQLNLNSNYWLLFKNSRGDIKTAIVHIPMFNEGESAEIVDRIDENVLCRLSLANRIYVSDVLKTENIISQNYKISEITGIYELDNTLDLMLDMGFPEDYILFWLFSDYSYLFSGDIASYGHTITYAELAEMFTDIIPPEYIFNTELTD